MKRVYKSNWSPKQLEINFNQKQWRQDLASFIVSKLYWSGVRVSRSRTIEKIKEDNSLIKEFTIYSNNGLNCTIQYKNKQEIVYSTHIDLILDYLEKRNVV